MPLPLQCQLRPARASDIGAIRSLVLGAFLDPTQLQWQQFWVITHQEQIIACGQLRRYGVAQELGSLVVRAGWRGQGLGRALVHHLITQAEGPLYLECLGRRRQEFFTQFGFKAADWQTMPTEMAAKFQLTRTLARLLPLPLYVMEH
jgi:amino-acid N-acetyltransferase